MYRKEMIYSKYADCEAVFQAVDSCYSKMSCEKFQKDDSDTYCPEESRRRDACLKTEGYIE